jgi:osmotically-inducible protein OsmY
MSSNDGRDGQHRAQALVDRLLRDAATWLDRNIRGEPRGRAPEHREEDLREKPRQQHAAGGGRYSGVGPKGYRRAPERLKELVAESLEDHPDLNATEIEIEVQGDEVTLTGRVPDRTQKRLAEACADSVRGVRDVHNRLTIDPTLE